MNRRKFIASTGAAVALRNGCMPAVAASGRRLLMKIGCQSAPTNETLLQCLARYGARNFCGCREIGEGRLYATVDELKRILDLAEKSGISTDCVAPPFLASTHVDQTPHPAIMLGDSPERDRDIEALQTFIRNCAAVGIPSIKYNLTLLGVLRTGRTPGRGDAMYSTWRLKDAHPKSPLTRAGRVDADIFWERIT
jgi:mannonate dehydratase